MLSKVRKDFKFTIPLIIMPTAAEKVEAAIKEFLGELPKLRGYSLKDLRRAPIYWPQERWHLERCEAPRSSNEEIGSFGKRVELIPKKY